jgi:hypothetical protein
MRTDEFKAALEAMDDAKFQQFRRDFGGDGKTRKWYVDNYVSSGGQWEGRLSQMLGISTEQERRDEAAITSAGATVTAADAAVKSENHARKANELADASNAIAKHANRLAFWSMILAGFALLVSASAILVAALKP